MPAELEVIQQAKRYAVSLGLDPEDIESIEDAKKLFNSIAADCDKYGCD